MQRRRRGCPSVAALTKLSWCRLLAAVCSSAWETAAVEAMGKTSMAGAVERGASAAVLAATALSAALVSIVGSAGLANSAAAWSCLGRLA